MTDLNPPARAKSTKANPKLKAAAASVHDAYDQLKEVAVDTLGETKDRLQAVVGDTTEEAQRRYGDVEAYVQLYPIRALGIAAAIGVVAGLILRPGKTVYVVEPR